VPIRAKRRKPTKKRHTVADYMAVLSQADSLAGDKARWEERKALLNVADKMEHDLLMRGEYHRRRKNRGRR
jgi:hypothetical protein